jgi:excinuclease UvrABC nuclease subunit
LIDGGKGQVSSVKKAVSENLEKSVSPKWKNVLVLGIFKPHDYLILERDKEYQIKRPDKNNLGYLHLVELRDEAHRFAKEYHKKLRRKALSD